MKLTFTKHTKILLVLLGSAVLLSCTAIKTDKTDKTDKTEVKRKLISAKSYNHPSKKSNKEDIQSCRLTQPNKKLDTCMAEKGWVLTSKQYN